MRRRANAGNMRSRLRRSQRHRVGLNRSHCHHAHVAGAQREFALQVIAYQQGTIARANEPFILRSVCGITFNHQCNAFGESLEVIHCPVDAGASGLRYFLRAIGLDGKQAFLSTHSRSL